jgi:hypothetical protein
MPWIHGRFYASPLYGIALERARSIDIGSKTRAGNEQEADAYWVTINGRHVLIREAAMPQGRPKPKTAKTQLSSRDRAYLDAYYDAVSALAEH